MSRGPAEPSSGSRFVAPTAKTVRPPAEDAESQREPGGAQVPRGTVTREDASARDELSE